MPPESFSVAEIRAAEKPLLDAGVPLMARAAEALAAELRSRAASGPVLALIGSGDNGGDALFAVAELAREGIDAAAVRAGSRVHEAAWADALEAGVREVTVPEAVSMASRASIVVDALRGIGGAGTGLRGAARDLVLALRQVDLPAVVAVDVPSGVDADTGEAGDDVLPADTTLTFGAMKNGLLREPARSLAGRVVVVDIGLGLPRD